MLFLLLPFASAMNSDFYILSEGHVTGRVVLQPGGTHSPSAQAPEGQRPDPEDGVEGVVDGCRNAEPPTQADDRAR